MNDKDRQKIVKLLTTAYNMELETIINYLANAEWLDGIRAKQIKDSLAADVIAELTHAQRLAKRIKTLDGRIPGSQELKMTQTYMQPPKKSIDMLAIIKGVIEAERGAIEHYQSIIEASDTIDPVTQDLCVELKGDEEEHHRLFKGFLLELTEG